MQQELLNYIYQQLHEKRSVITDIIPQIIDAGNKVAEVMLSQNRLFICSNDASYVICQYFASLLFNGDSLQRPSLPAILLQNNSFMQSRINKTEGEEHQFSRQLTCLGQPGDCLLLLSIKIDIHIVQLINCAHDHGITIIAVGCDTDQHLFDQLNDLDIGLSLPYKLTSECLENQLTIVHVLHKVIEYRLFMYPFIPDS